jgi:hypothetical protein
MLVWRGGVARVPSNQDDTPNLAARSGFWKKLLVKVFVARTVTIGYWQLRGNLNLANLACWGSQLRAFQQAPHDSDFE